ncbi:MAG: TonB-dependent receptor [Magnetococcales bacterium]|nr:TonB-dependent receptor [Magnetococcales bacterium]
MPFSRTALLILSGILIAPGALAAETLPPPEKAAAEEEQRNQEGLHDLLAIMVESTEIATKTRLNADFVPGMVTVLKGDDLKSRGIRTVDEALNLVPGVSYSNSGVLNVRGTMSQTSGKVKLLLNGASINDSISALGVGYNIPIEMVDRIEVIRGPGSAVYGEYAFGGVINIITRQDGNRLYGGMSSFHSHTGGGLFSSENKGWRTTLNASGWNSEGDNLLLKKDALYGVGLASISLAPGLANNAVQSRNAILTVQHDKTALLAQYVAEGAGDMFGQNNMLPPPGKRLVYDNSMTMLEAQQGFNPTSDLAIQAKAGLMESTMGIDHLFAAPPGYNIQASPNPNDGSMVGNGNATEQRLYAGLSSDWKGWQEHTESLGVDWATIRLENVWTSGNFDPTTGAPTATTNRFPAADNWILAAPSHRDILGLMAQDQWDITRDLTSTAGLRFDHYSDVGASVTPRLALVYRLSDKHILKAQYGTAFRPPTFLELYPHSVIIGPNPNIKPETVQTMDLGYIYRDEKSVGRVTVFHSEIQDLILLVSDATGAQFYKNVADVRVNGAEVELERGLTSQLKLNTNLSYVTTRNEATGREQAGVANWMGNLGLLYQPEHDYSLSLQGRTMGSRQRDVQDTRTRLGSDTTLDLTGSVFNVGMPGVTLRVGVKNLLDTDTSEVATTIIPTQIRGATTIPAYPAYPNDFPEPGREVWFSLSYDF